VDGCGVVTEDGDGDIADSADGKFIVDAIGKLEIVGFKVMPGLVKSALVERARDGVRYWKHERHPTLGMFGSLMSEPSTFLNAAFLQMPLELRYDSRADRKAACLTQLNTLANMTEGALAIQHSEDTRWGTQLTATCRVGSSSDQLKIKLGPRINLLAAIVELNSRFRPHLGGQFVTFPDLFDSGGLDIAYVAQGNFATTEALLGEVWIVDDVRRWPDDLGTPKLRWYIP
jgi:hypothetical protein